MATTATATGRTESSARNRRTPRVRPGVRTAGPLLLIANRAATPFRVGHLKLFWRDPALGADVGDRGEDQRPLPAQALARDVVARRVMEGGAVVREEAGTPQGGSISPCLCNVYLHRLAHWDERGTGVLVRFADDLPQPTGGRGRSRGASVEPGWDGPAAQAGQDPDRAGRVGPSGEQAHRGTFSRRNSGQKGRELLARPRLRRRCARRLAGRDQRRLAYSA